MAVRLSSSPRRRGYWLTRRTSAHSPTLWSSRRAGQRPTRLPGGRPPSMTSRARPKRWSRCSKLLSRGELQGRPLALADRVLVALLRLERLAGQARTAAGTPLTRFPGRLLPTLTPLWGRLTQAAESRPDRRRAQHPAGGLAFLVIEEAGRPEQQRIGEPEDGPTRQAPDARGGNEDLANRAHS